MLKSELIEKLNNIDGDVEIAFPDLEYGGFMAVNRINIKKVFKITEEGKRKCPETGTDYLENDIHDKERLDELYDTEEKTIIVLS